MKRVLIICGRYLPGYKDGGPVRTIKNLVDTLGKDYHFDILTCDRDHGDAHTYSNIEPYKWYEVGNARVFYVPPHKFKFSIIANLSKKVDMIYLCGCFRDYAIKTLLLKRIGIIRKPVVIASMGLFNKNGFNIKRTKKELFVSVANFIGLFKNIYWSASSEREQSDILDHIKTDPQNIFIALDLPRVENRSFKFPKNNSDTLRIVWLSRISPEKNLLGTIEVLGSVKSKIEFSIYGPKQDPNYWKKCEEKLINLPDNICWKWLGNVESEKVVEVFSAYDVFVFNTLGENYGHVIHEAMLAGCAVIISNHTPWKDLEKHNVGYVIDLDDKECWVNAIEKFAALNDEEMRNISTNSYNYAKRICEEAKLNNGYRTLFEAIK